MSVEKSSSSGRYNPPFMNLVDVDKDYEDFEPFEGADGVETTPRTHPGHGPVFVRKVDMCQHINKPYHHTTEYETHNLVVRRGQRFIVQVHFSRRLTSDDDFQLEFLIGNSPAPDKGSLVAVTFNQRRGGSWRGELLEERDSVLTLGITPTPDAIVGKFRTYVAIVGARGMQRTKRDPTTDLYLLFNAWCPYDTVFVSDENERMEYVLNEHGMIITGSIKRPSSRRWEYGQFERGVLDACISILDRSRMPIFNRSNIIKVVRKASAMINAQDDNGVLVGNWSDNYNLGTPPGAWTGSVPILLKYANSGVPVNYAQCWVFAGVLNTFLRCLGIPARIITNFCSAHDNTGNLKTDLIFSPDGTPDHRNTRDSIWNFHCWNEVFIHRDDIPKKYSGWQVVDATPQETSDGLYRCGPASVAAIKDGQVMHPFDCGFVFAEVNSDVVFHKRDKYGTLKVTRVDKTWVGQAMYTKAVGAFVPVEVTGNYKYPEGSPMNDKSMEEAESYGLARDHSEVSDAPVFVFINCDQTFVSQNVELDVVFRNSGSVPKTIDAHLDVNSIFYTGTPYEHCKDENFTVTVPANDTMTMKFTVSADEYLPRLGSGSSLQVIVTGEIEDQTISNVQTINLQMPKLSMTVSGKPQVNQDMEVTVSFQNPLKITLEGARLLVEGNGLLECKFHHYRTIEPDGQISVTESFSPRRPGPRTLVAVMVCDNLDEVRGSVDVDIEPAEEWSALLHPGSS
ncbi:coagulation factor XIII A chain-like [Sphaeramia orbicularis]|uniref:coagulation factor XIII A chain-like n=1 Tax=Sphaeramia orbicularis TaxID=375764 RepID=UPI00117E5762|nr:coagulation factor XIII A chain-like [Sphaeramia orbicularis]